MAARMCVLPDLRTNSRPQSHPTWSANKPVGARFLSQCEVRASRLANHFEAQNLHDLAPKPSSLCLICEPAQRSWSQERHPHPGAGDLCQENSSRCRLLAAFSGICFWKLIAGGRAACRIARPLIEVDHPHSCRCIPILLT